MNTTKVQLTLRSTHFGPGGADTEEEKLTGTWTGPMGRRGEKEPAGSPEKGQLTWADPVQAGLGRTENLLELHAAGMVLRKRGDTSARMVFRPGKSTCFDYHTPYGALPMAVHTRAASWQVTGTGGRVELDYGLSVADGAEERVKLEISFTF